jgi:hypothetical protein
MDTAATTAGRAVPWNKGKLLGQKPPLKLKDTWAIRIRLQLDRRIRELALFNSPSIASKRKFGDLAQSGQPAPPMDRTAETARHYASPRPRPALILSLVNDQEGTCCVYWAQGGSTMLIRWRWAACLVVTIAFGVESGMASAQVLFVPNFSNNSVTFYARTANGNVAPVRTIAGAATGLSGPFAVAVDAVNKELFVANSTGDSITVYPVRASGNIAPLRTLSGIDTGLSSIEGIFVDTVNNELYVANNFDPGTVTVYSRTAGGNTAPIRTLSGAATGLLFPISVTVDTVNNELFVANNNGSTSASSITVYARTATGNSAPLRTIGGASTGIVNPDATAVDLVNNELVVADCNSYVSVFARTASGNVAPLRTIAGVATGLDCAIGLNVDTVNNEFEVSSYFTNSVVAFARTANGNVAPLRTIVGAATRLGGPGFLAVGCKLNQKGTCRKRFSKL